MSQDRPTLNARLGYDYTDIDAPVRVVEVCFGETTVATLPPVRDTTEAARHLYGEEREQVEREIAEETVAPYLRRLFTVPITVTEKG